MNDLKEHVKSHTEAVRAHVAGDEKIVTEITPMIDDNGRAFGLPGASHQAAQPYLHRPSLIIPLGVGHVKRLLLW